MWWSSRRSASDNGTRAGGSSDREVPAATPRPGRRDGAVPEPVVDRGRSTVTTADRPPERRDAAAARDAHCGERWRDRASDHSAVSEVHDDHSGMAGPAPVDEGLPELSSDTRLHATGLRRGAR